jgi:nucleotide-binding universal stress UspA family protein
MYNHVLVGTDGSDTATRAVEAAARLAQAHQARLTIAHAFDARQPHPTVTSPVAAEMGWLASPGVRAEAVVNAAVNRAQEVACGGLSVEGVAEPGHPVTVMLAVADELEPDAVVVGNADIRRFRLRRSIGHALSRRVQGDVVIVDTVGANRARRGGAA